MSKNELIKKLEAISGNPEVMIPDTTGEFDYSTIEEVKLKDVTFSDGDLEAADGCIIIESF